MEKDKKENCKNCDDCQKHQEHAFELEVDEDIQQEKIKHFWAKYRFLVYATIVLILAATAGIQLYQSWKMKLRLAESDAFENAVVQLYAHKEEEALPALQALAQNGKTGYRYLAQLEFAGALMRSNKTEEALGEFKNLMNSRAPQNLRQVARLSYVGQLVDTADPKEMLEILDPTIKDPHFVGMAAELASVLYLRENKKQDALDMLQSALSTPNLSPVVTKRLQSLKQMIENN